MTLAPGRVACHVREPLAEGWEVTAVPAGAATQPSQLRDLCPGPWIGDQRLGPAAAVLRDAGRWSLDAPARRFDAEDWWYRLRFESPTPSEDEALVLGFDGLATVAQAWLNGEPLLASDNMFVASECRIGARCRPGTNELMLRFASLDALLQPKRPRPRWRAPMIENQQLRWFRTTLLGRTPGWSPPAAVVGPWRDIWLERRRAVEVHGLRVSCDLDGSTGTVSVGARLIALGAEAIEGAWLELRRDGRCWREACTRDGPERIAARLSITDVEAWWPHTHGEPALYDASLVVRLSSSQDTEVDLGRLGFRRIEIDRSGGRFSLQVNGAPVFCRGACWTPIDVVSLHASDADYRVAIEQVRAAGMNMLRLAGTMVYESPAFHATCDAAGMLVWQEFMFANMDYPHDDASFTASARAEVLQHAVRLQGHPSTAMLCGNSEVEQQAAMWGAPRELWSPALFHAAIPSWLDEAGCSVPYWPSSAHGGAFPFQGDAGTTSYYGVGAYRRPLEDARRSALSFATECLAFANVPDDATISRMPKGHALRVHHPEWKARTPRDLGAGWDFEDVRDHYLHALHGVDPSRLRCGDHGRYLALSRVVTGEVMAASFTEWRRRASGTGGALVWLLRDLWAGAGWGLLDDEGRPKPCFYQLSRVLQPIFIGLTDEGGNGLTVHAANDKPAPLDATLVVSAYGESQALVAHAQRQVSLAARDAASWPVAGLFDGFIDLSAAYRFGPPPATLVVASLRDKDESTLAEAFHFPAGRASQVEEEIGLSTECVSTSDGRLEVVVHSKRFADSVQVELAGYRASDNHFHLAPATARSIALVADGRPSASLGTVSALNARRTAHFQRGT